MGSLIIIMTNVTLSIDDKVYKRMRKYSEIKWSEFIRKKIQERLDELESLDMDRKDTLLCMLASENSLKEVWDNEEDERWNEY